jgi:hypothetical protein
MKFPLGQEPSFLIEDLDAVVFAIGDEESAARIDRQPVRRLELAGRGSPLAPRLHEPAVLRELQDARVRRAPVAVADEDVAARRDQHGGRHIEGVGTVTGNARPAERYQDLAVLIHLEHLVAFPIPPQILAVRPFAVGNPDIAVAIDVDAVRTDEHPRPKALDRLPRGVELQNGSDRRPDAVVRPASLEDPDAGAVAVDGDTGGGPYPAAIRHLEVVRYDFVWVCLCGEDHRRREDRSGQSYEDCSRHANPPDEGPSIRGVGLNGTLQIYPCGYCWKARSAPRKSRQTDPARAPVRRAVRLLNRRRAPRRLPYNSRTL